MTDKEYKAQVARIRKLWKKWGSIHGLNEQWLNLEYDRERSEDSPSEAAMTSWRWHYKHASVTFRIPACKDLDDEQLENVVVHEMAHILTGAMASAVPTEDKNLMEFSTETVARALIWAREAGAKDAARAAKTKAASNKE